MDGKTVSANGPAGVSGVKENDVIEAVDNQTLSAETINSKTFSVKTITVMRNGENYKSSFGISSESRSLSYALI